MENVRLQFLSLRQGTASRICRASHSTVGWRLSRPAWCGQLDFGFRRRSEIDVTNSERVGSQFLSLRQVAPPHFSPRGQWPSKKPLFGNVLRETSAPQARHSDQIAFSGPRILQTLGLRPKSAEVFGFEFLSSLKAYLPITGAGWRPSEQVAAFKILSPFPSRIALAVRCAAPCNARGQSC